MNELGIKIGASRVRENKAIFRGERDCTIIYSYNDKKSHENTSN
jgi:hypothetical protein